MSNYNVEPLKKVIDLLGKIVSIENEEVIYGHSLNVGKVARMIAEKMNMNSKEIELVYLAGIFHDIGKLHISSSIIQKPGQLTIVEFEEIMKHPKIGYDMLKSLENFDEVANIVLQHHERVDGKGYPYALKGDEISIYAKIISISDSYDAMREERHYKKSHTLDEALSEIKRGAGSQFDPHVARIFVEKVIGRDWDSINILRNEEVASNRSNKVKTNCEPQIAKVIEKKSIRR